jgi:hypothetical protein
MLKFIYLQAGSDPKYQTELRYSISTLLAEMPEAAGNIIIYTDSPSSYASEAHIASTWDITSTIEEMVTASYGKYSYRAKPCILLHALRTNGCACVFLDTDTFVKRGFAKALRKKLLRGAVMDSYLRRNPFPECTGVQSVLPSGVTYRYDPKTAVMYNSGVIGVCPDHAIAIEDSIAIIDVIRPLSLRAKDQEQYAINEALRLHGIPVSTIDTALKHYCQRWQKRYMHWRFSMAPYIAPNPISARRPQIFVNKPIGWCFKQASRFL